MLGVAVPPDEIQLRRSAFLYQLMDRTGFLVDILCTSADLVDQFCTALDMMSCLQALPVLLRCRLTKRFIYYHFEQTRITAIKQDASQNVGILNEYIYTHI